MIIKSLKTHFPARFPEWLVSGVLVSWGMYVWIHPDLFTNDATRVAFAGLVEMTEFTGHSPSAVWGLAALMVGVIRTGALFINGIHTRTPMIRLGMSFLSAFIWTQVAVGFGKSGVPNPGIILYAWLVVIDIASAYRAGLDVALSEKVRHDTNKGIEDRAANNSVVA